MYINSWNTNYYFVVIEKYIFMKFMNKSPKAD